MAFVPLSGTALVENKYIRGKDIKSGTVVPLFLNSSKLKIIFDRFF